MSQSGTALLNQGDLGNTGHLGEEVAGPQVPMVIPMSVKVPTSPSATGSCTVDGDGVLTSPRAVIAANTLIHPNRCGSPFTNPLTTNLNFVGVLPHIALPI